MDLFCAGCRFFYFLFIYLCILSECHSNGRMSICMTTGLRSREGAPGRDSIHKQELARTPLHPPYLQYSSYGLTNAYIAQRIPTTLCAKYDNKGRRAGCLYCYFSRDKTIVCLIATAQQKNDIVSIYKLLFKETYICCCFKIPTVMYNLQK